MLWSENQLTGSGRRLEPNNFLSSKMSSRYLGRQEIVMTQKTLFLIRVREIITLKVNNNLESWSHYSSRLRSIKTDFLILSPLRCTHSVTSRKYKRSFLALQWCRTSPRYNEITKRLSAFVRMSSTIFLLSKTSWRLFRMSLKTRNYSAEVVFKTLSTRL